MGSYNGAEIILTIILMNSDIKKESIELRSVVHVRFMSDLCSHKCHLIKPNSIHCCVKCTDIVR